MKQGQQQQRYRVLERLAAGGMAEVYLAESAGIEGFKKRVAIKRVLPHLSEKKRFIAMFLDEARVSAHLTHSNVAQVFDIGVGGDNAYFIVMEYVDGSDLRAIIEFLRKTKRSFPVEAAAYIVEKICEGLSYAHEARSVDGAPLYIVHRDVSPANVLLTRYGEVKIVDFGLAKATSQLEKSEPGIVKGKFGYLSPEAANGIEVDARADVFATGILLWEMLAGKRLFLAGDDYATIARVKEAMVPPLAPINKEVPPELERIIGKALARDRDKRYQTAREMGRELNAFMFGLGRPVGAHDVAELVDGTMALRRTASKEKDGALGKLIAQVLLEFQSLQGGNGPSGAKKASDTKEVDAKEAITARPPSPDVRERISRFENVADWAAELDDGPGSKEREARSFRTPVTESAVAPTMKATPLALAGGAVSIGEVEEGSVEGGDVPSDAGAQEESPAATLRESPRAKVDTAASAPATENKAAESAAPTLKATPRALAGEATDESPVTARQAPAARSMGKAKGKRSKGKAKVRAAREGSGEVAGAIEVAAAMRVQPDASKSGPSSSKAWLIVAALVVVVALLYFGGVISR